MSGTYSTDELMLALLVEARVQTQILADEFGRDDDLEEMRADQIAELGLVGPLAAQN